MSSRLALTPPGGSGPPARPRHKIQTNLASRAGGGESWHIVLSHLIISSHTRGHVLLTTGHHTHVARVKYANNVYTRPSHVTLCLEWSRPSHRSQPIRGQKGAGRTNQRLEWGAADQLEAAISRHNTALTALPRILLHSRNNIVELNILRWNNISRILWCRIS